MEYKAIDIVKYYGDLKVLDGITMDFQPNKTTCILGPSGCGKTTFFKYNSRINRYGFRRNNWI